LSLSGSAEEDDVVGVEEESEVPFGSGRSSRYLLDMGLIDIRWRVVGGFLDGCQGWWCGVVGRIEKDRMNR
jgi:hypothetical protein